VEAFIEGLMLTLLVSTVEMKMDRIYTNTNTDSYFVLNSNSNMNSGMCQILISISFAYSTLSNRIWIQIPDFDKWLSIEFIECLKTFDRTDGLYLNHFHLVNTHRGCCKAAPHAAARLAYRTWEEPAQPRGAARDVPACLALLGSGRGRARLA
jgi:hypothetical protein